MIFDDRLETVLRNEPAPGEAGFIQYLQLIDLLGRRPAEGPIPEEALDRLAELEDLLSAEERGVILQSSAPVLRHSELVLRLASQVPSIAAAALGAARLGDADWSALIPALPAHARAILRDRADLGPLAQETLSRFADQDSSAPGLAKPGSEGEATFPPADLEPPGKRGLNHGEGIAAIVRRIEALRRTRGTEASAAAANERSAASTPAERLAPLTTATFQTDASGAIVEADRESAPMLVGLQLGQRGRAAPARCDSGTVAALAWRGPVNGGGLFIDGARRVSGAWRIDATPRFDPASGGFIGYAGLLRRPARSTTISESADGAVRAEVMQTLHELHTPIHAIQGFAELIRHQGSGSVPHLYAGQAASIAADVAQILAAIDDVDQLVADKPNASAEAEETCDLAALARDVDERLEQGLGSRGPGFILNLPEKAPAALSEVAARQLLWRLMAALATIASPSERLGVKIEGEDEHIVLTVDLPEQWVGSGADALLSIGPNANLPVTPSPLGSGFAFRLVAAQAARAGGSLKLGEDRLALRLPRAGQMEAAVEQALLP